MTTNPIRENCHDKCTQTTLHSICLMPAPLKTPVMAQMLHKLETLPYKKQNEKTFSQYAGVERLMR